MLNALSKILNRTITATSDTSGAVAVGASAGLLSTSPECIISFGLAGASLLTYQLVNDFKEAREAKEQSNKLNVIRTAIQTQREKRESLASQIAAKESVPAETVLGSELKDLDYVWYQFARGEFGTLEELIDQVRDGLSKNREAVLSAIKNSDELQRQLAVLVLHEFQDLGTRLAAIEAGIVTRDDLRELSRGIERSTGDIIKRLAEQSPHPKLRLQLIASDTGDIERFHYLSRRVPLFGRGQEMQELRGFLQPAAPGEVDVKWWLWTGPGGMGKSRLGLELCLEAIRDKWLAGFLDKSSSFDQWSDYIVNVPTLIVVDYVSERASRIRDAIDALSSHPENLKAPLRFLLLERHANDDHDEWWRQFQSYDSGTKRSSMLAAGFRGRSGFKVNTRELGPLGKPSLVATARHVFESLATEIEQPAIFDGDGFADALRKIDPLGRPLFAAFAAEAVAREGLENIRSWNQQDLTLRILKHEISRWETQAKSESDAFGNDNLDHPHVNLLAATTIVGRQNHDFLGSVTALDVALPTPNTFSDNLFGILTGLSAGSDGNDLPSLEPDIVGELFVLERLSGSLRLPSESNTHVVASATQELIKELWCMRPVETSSFIGRSLRDFPDHPSVEHLMFPGADCASFNGEPRSLIQALLVRASAFYYSNHLDSAIRDLGDVISFPDASVELVATALFNRGATYSQQGKVDEALADYTRLIDNLPDAPVEQVATALCNRGVAYSQQGKVDEARQDLLRAVGNECLGEDTRRAAESILAVIDERPGPETD